MALGQRLRRSRDRNARRYTLALFGTVVAWVLLLIGALVTILSGREATAILPPLDRVATVISIVLLAWAFLTADHSRGGRVLDTLVVLVLVLVIAGYAVTANQWAEIDIATDFNLSQFGVAWTIVPGAFALLGMMITLLYVRFIVDAPLKLVFFALLLLGYGATLVQMAQGNLIGDYAGTARLAFLAALAVMPMIVYRMVVGHLIAESRGTAQTISPLGMTKSSAITGGAAGAPTQVARAEASPIERESVRLLRALGIMLESVDPSQIPNQVVKAAMNVLKVDVGALLRVQDANYADIVTAYDKIMEREISGISLNLDDQPTLVNAVERQAQRPLLIDRNPAELKDLYTRLDIGEYGPTYYQPLVHNNEVVAVLVVGMPYVKRELLRVDEELLKGLGVIASSLIALSYTADDTRMAAQERAMYAMLQGVRPDDVEDDHVVAARQELEASLQLARDQITNLNQQVRDLKLELDDERTRIVSLLGDTQQGLSVSQRIIALHEAQAVLREERDLLTKRLQEADATLVGATATTSEAVVNNMVESLQKEKAELEAERNRLQQQLDELRTKDKPGLKPEDIKRIISHVTSETTRLKTERDQINDQLSAVRGQLEGLGIQVKDDNLAQLISKLYEERANFQSKMEALKTEREAFLAEREKLADVITREQERDARIETLQTQIKHLAADRETAYKQRDAIRAERDDLNERLESVKENRVALVAQSSSLELQVSELTQELRRVREDLEQLQIDQNDWFAERDKLLVEQQVLKNERDKLRVQVQGNDLPLKEIGDKGSEKLQQMVDDLTNQRKRLERELATTRNALLEVENQLGQVQKDATNGDVPRHYQAQNPELLIGIVHDLRTPMTSIIGYIDLLLGESAGILGEMQRKFLQRVAANVSRLATMLDDLLRLAQLDTGRFELIPEPVDMVAVIENAITNASNQFREKGLTVHLDLEDTMPPLPADRDAMTQIIGQLLTNAYLVSPPDTEVFITAKKQVEPDPDEEELQIMRLFVSVEDRGGGIAPENEARVFARKYKADNPLIQGLGDTGVGLSIAKALVEAHGGRLWLESQEGVGSAFKFTIPFQPVADPEG